MLPLPSVQYNAARQVQYTLYDVKNKDARPEARNLAHTKQPFF